MEYLYPGVYVEEYQAGTKSIPGVPVSTGDGLASIASTLREAVLKLQPEWTGRNESDPGITLVELLAWLAESLLYRSGAIPDEARRAVMRAVAALSMLTEPCGPASRPLKRPHFFAGRLLDAATLQAEQDYHREKQRRQNRALHGWGVVDGLQVGVEPAADGGRISIAPGVAIDPCGNLVVLDRSVAIALPAAPTEVFASIRYQDIPCGPVPAPRGGADFALIEEASVVSLLDTVPSSAIALARLLRSDGWAVDPSFVRRSVSRDRMQL